MEKRLDVSYTNGVIAVREKYLLKDKVSRMCELTADDAFRLLLESGFGGGAETATGVYDYEKLIAAENEKLDAFIREYAPSKAEAAYLLAPRDFHNAKALIKAAYLNESAERMLASEGLISVDTLSACVKNGDFSALDICPALQKACRDATALLAEDASGSKVGAIFENALYGYLRGVVKRKPVLKKLLTAKADMTNILTAFRLDDKDGAVEKYVPAGSLKADDLAVILDGDLDAIKAAFKKTAYADFVAACAAAREKGVPMTQAEKMLGAYDAAHFSARKYALEKTEPFLYYVYRRKTESANVRIIFVCLLAGLEEQDIKRRIRTF
ncbi:MAG: V-type ATPase subunit [Clostridia bacterium]|nr:V-type ATPase subunit [Clostridia bacterium]